MFHLFLNPWYAVAGAALISVPIIIHLINRMRFRRVRWAAMEFLLKAQKRNRRRLIIEQLLLLALRCLLVALAGLLVLRFVGFSWANLQGKTTLHLVLLDDTPSMGDQWKEADATRDGFAVAKKDILQDKIIKSLSQAAATDKLIVLPFSHVADPDAATKVYDHLNDPRRLEELGRDVEGLELTKLHVDPLTVVKRAQAVIADHAESQVNLHVLADFRQKEWGLPEAEGLYRTLIELAKTHKDMKVRLIDTAHPYRTAGQTGYPASHDNVGILDLRPGTRVAGKNMPVNFTITLANYSGREAEVIVVLVDETTGREMLEVDFNPPMPLKLSPGSLTSATFDLRFNPQLKGNEVHFAHLSARLRNAQLNELQNDGLLIDNVRYAAVEVREKVPVLVIDGEGSKGREEGRDTFFLRNGLVSVPGASYQVVYGDELGGGVGAKALERADLHKYPTIFLLNVRELTPKQLTNLENFARDGGGVAFFMGPLVAPKYYNKSLYKDGKGLFPVPLKESYYPPPSEEPLPPKASDTPQLLLREAQFPNARSYPIFGAMFEKPEHREPLKDLPIRRYFQVPRAAWQPEPGKVFELATLPNDQPVTAYQQAVLDIVRGEPARAILANPEYAKYRRAVERHFKEIETLIGPTSEKKAYHLAAAFDALLTDQGIEKGREAAPNLTELWANADPKVQAVKREVVALRDQVHYGDPFIVSQTFGKGKVVAVMSTAGKEWNDWGGGSAATVLYTPFIWEMQNYLSSQGGESNLTVGTPVELRIDAEQYRKKNEALTLTRSYLKPQDKAPAKAVKLSEEAAREENGQLTFRFTKGREPGLYVSELNADGTPAGKGPLAAFGHVFNIDTAAEGPLQRVSHDQLDRELARSPELPEGTIRVEGPGVPNDDLVTRRSDFSESPLFFLFFLCVLVAEQALAVHLSFHLKGNETEMLTQVARPKAA